MAETGEPVPNPYSTACSKQSVQRRFQVRLAICDRWLNGRIADYGDEKQAGKCNQAEADKEQDPLVPLGIGVITCPWLERHRLIDLPRSRAIHTMGSWD
jgi:hypothetical protein